MEFAETTAEQIVGVVDFVVSSGGIAGDEDVAAFLAVTDDHARRAITGAVALNFFARGRADGRYTAPALTTRLLAQAHVDDKRRIFRAHLEDYAPYLWIKNRLLQGIEFTQACAEAKSKFALAADLTIIRQTIYDWGTYAQSLIPGTGAGVQVATATSTVVGLSAAIAGAADDEAAVRALVSSQIGPAFDRLPENVRNNLLLGFQKYKNNEDAKGIAQPLGVAFEDFLRSVADLKQVDVSKANGIIEVANELRSRKVITKKHLGLADAIGQIRIVCEHGVDKDENATWTFSPLGLQTLMISIMTAIRSLDAYLQGTYDL